MSGVPAESRQRPERVGGGVPLVSRERQARASGRAAALARAAAPDPTWRKVRGGARVRGRAGPRPPGARVAPLAGVASPFARGPGQPPCGASAFSLCGTGSALPAAGGPGRPRGEREMAGRGLPCPGPRASTPGGRQGLAWAPLPLREGDFLGVAVALGCSGWWGASRDIPPTPSPHFAGQAGAAVGDAACPGAAGTRRARRGLSESLRAAAFRGVRRRGCSAASGSLAAGSPFVKFGL